MSARVNVFAARDFLTRARTTLEVRPWPPDDAMQGTAGVCIRTIGDAR